MSFDIQYNLIAGETRLKLDNLIMMDPFLNNVVFIGD